MTRRPRRRYTLADDIGLALIIGASAALVIPPIVGNLT